MSNTKRVNDFLDKLKHPLKAEMVAVRNIITGSHPHIAEDIKWRGLGFSYKQDMAALNPRVKDYVAITFHKGALIADKPDFFEPDEEGRVHVKLHNMADIKVKKAAIEKMVTSWVQLMDNE